jgi:hypothetical protein
MWNLGEVIILDNYWDLVFYQFKPPQVTANPWWAGVFEFFGSFSMALPWGQVPKNHW